VLATLRRGDIIHVPSGRRAGLAVVLNPPPAGAEFSPNRADGPLVLTVHGQLKQLSAADFPVPASPVDRVRVPPAFSERSPKHRRDLVSAMRSKVEGRGADAAQRRRRSGTADEDPERGRGSADDEDDLAVGSGRSRYADEDGNEEDRDGRDGGRDGRGGRRGGGAEPDDDERAAQGDIAELRRRLRRHPCHQCPDREQHARYAERYFRQQKEVDDLERQVAGRQHVIARTFDRVCTVLDELSYLDGDKVTPAGQRLTRLYAELDLLAAECLRRGLWDGLNPAELAACVSMLSFESRRQVEDAGPARLPQGPVRDVLTAMARTWGELDHLEQRHGLSFLREPDPGFVWAAYRWARGAKLEDVLDSVPGLTPGDFVRSMKQLIDLLDQVAVASRPDAPSRRDAARAGGTRPDPEPGGPEPGGPEPGDEDAGDRAPGHGRPAGQGAPKDRDVAATARAAIAAMRRGVIAYSGLAD